MPFIRPFKGLRYNTEITGDISQIVAPPYDIIYDEWREKLFSRNPYNIIRLIKTKEEPTDSDSPCSRTRRVRTLSQQAFAAERENKYTRACAYIESWMREGVLKIDEEPSIYIRSETYKINGEMKTRYGFIALLRIEEFGKGVHPHERTMSAPREDRLKLVKATRTNLSQIFSIFRDPSNKIQKLLLKAAESKPEESFTDEQGIIRKLWTVKDPNIISEIQSAMKEQDIIIADGHHRYETALEYKSYMESTRQNDEEPFDYVSMYFSSANDSGLTILPTHRKVSGLPWYDSDKFLKDLKQYFAIEFLGKVSLYDVLELITDNSVINNIFGIYTSENFWTARYLNSTNPKELDVDILHNIIIEKILGISREDIALGRYVHFCKSPEHAVEDVTHLKDQVSFLMNAMKPEELFSRVLNGFRMPQKSTYFYPKTLSGLVMYFIDKQSLE